MKTKLAQLREHMAADDWQAAVLLAAKFGELGAARNAVLSAREAYLRPAFQKQLGRDPAALIAAGKAALIERYGDV
jgi:hypothetical protein